MQTAPRITFHGVRASDAVTADILSRLQKLEKYAPRLTAARVAVELRGRHQQAGNRFRVTISLGMPGETLVVQPRANLRSAARSDDSQTLRKHDKLDPDHRHAKVAVREAFEVARRQVQDYVRRQRGDVKRHTTPAAARVPLRA